MTANSPTSLDSDPLLETDESTFAGRLALSVSEAATALGLSRTLINQECASGRLHSIKVGARRVIPVASLEAWLRGEEPPSLSTPTPHAPRAKGR